MLKCMAREILCGAIAAKAKLIDQNRRSEFSAKANVEPPKPTVRVLSILLSAVAATANVEPPKPTARAIYRSCCKSKCRTTKSYGQSSTESSCFESRCRAIRTYGQRIILRQDVEPSKPTAREIIYCSCCQSRCLMWTHYNLWPE